MTFVTHRQSIFVHLRLRKRKKDEQTNYDVEMICYSEENEKN